MEKAEDTLLPENASEDAGAVQTVDAVAQSVEELSALAARMRAPENGKMILPAQEVLPPLPQAAPVAPAIQQLTLDLEKKNDPARVQKNAAKASDKADVAKSESPTKIMSASAQPPAPPVKRQRVGELLKEARVRFGYAVDVIAEELKVKPELVEAVEEGDFTGFSSRTYAIGFVRTYAALLNLNVDELVLRTRSEISGVLPQQAAAFVPLEEIQPHNHLPSLSAIVSGLAVLLVVYALGYSFFRTPPVTEDSPASLAAALPVAPTPSVAPVVAQNAVSPNPVSVPQTIAQNDTQNAAGLEAGTNAAPLAPVQPVSALAPAQMQPPQGVNQPSLNQQGGTQPSLASAANTPNSVDRAIATLATAQEQMQQAAAPAPTSAPVSSEVLPKFDDNSPTGEPAREAQVPVTTKAPTSMTVTPVPARASADAPRRITSRIRLQATDSITVQIFDAKGHMLAERQIAKGEAFFVPDNADYTMATSNAGAMRVQVDGRELPPLGAPDEAVHNIPLNADELLNAMN